MRTPGSCRSFAEEPGLRGRLFPLLDRVFPGIAGHAKRVGLDGGRWEDVSTPFVREEGGEVVAHVGLLELPLVVMGREVRVGAVHAVCTEPGCRGRGYFRGLIGDALKYAEGRYETVVLFTGRPELYGRFGFRVVPESRFVVGVKSAGGGKGGFWAVRFGEAGERALVERLLERREPVSHVLGEERERGVFSFNRPEEGLVYSEELGVVGWLEVVGTTLRLFDVIGPRVPRLVEIVKAVGPPVERVEVFFSPDRLDVRGAEVVPYRHEKLSLMVRGAFEAEGEPFMVPVAARC